MSDQEKEELYKGLVWKPYIECSGKGGQIAGWPEGYKGARLIHKELQFEVACNYKRSMMENKEMCMTFFELFLLEVIK